MFWIGIDLGQASDYTAITIVEVIFEPSGINSDGSPMFEKKLHCRHAQRLPLEMTYPEQVSQVARMTKSNPLLDKCRVVVDATGVGRPVVDLMGSVGIAPTSIIITGGYDENIDQHTGYWSVPKRVLISNLQVLLGKEMLLFADSLELKNLLISEITNFKIKISSKGNDTYEAWREGDHDDLVLSLALACWAAVKLTSPPSRPQQRNPWLKRSNF